MEPCSLLNTAQTTTTIIRNRRSIYPPSYTDQLVEDHIIEEMLENANHAPTHRLTEPWRFKIIAGDKRLELGELLANYYRLNTAPEQFKEGKYEQLLEKGRRSSHIIAIAMHRDKKERVPEWEEVAATAMAVQNMWLTATAYQIGAYWSSPSIIKSEECRQFLQLNEQERCLGFLFLGYHLMAPTAPQRSSIASKVQWL